MSKLILACDGGCRGNGNETNVGGWGVYLLFGTHEKELKGFELNTTNQRMELMALFKGLEAINKPDVPLEVYTDSAYIVNCFNQKWYEKWLLNGWRTSKKQPVEHRDLWEKILEQYHLFSDITFIHVKGHSGHVYNERADRLVNQAMNERGVA